MSEYQFYEFLALDRPLTEKQLAELRSVSTRAEITATRFVNEYHWGNFRGDPQQMMERYFDAFLYLANWGKQCHFAWLIASTPSIPYARFAPTVNQDPDPPARHPHLAGSCACTLERLSL